MKKIIFLALLLVAAAPAFSQERPTHEIHAAMLYNFIKYVQWPNESEPGDFIIGVIGDEQLFNTLKQWYDGKAKGAKKYSIRKLGAPNEAGDCNVVYLGKSKNREFDDIRTTITGKPVLTITDGNGLGQKGSCINFKVVDGKLKFELNQAVIGTSNLKVSSQLTSMAILI